MMHSLGSLQISKAKQGVTSAIQQASARTGVDFGYLMKQAEVESSLNPNAKAKTSSATGLYQFVEQTWLRMVKNHGDEYGMDRFADAIKQRGDGSFIVANRGLKNQILSLRRDPKASSLMAAELAQENHKHLQEKVGGKVSGTDLYLAHFLGAQGASNFLNAMKKNPWAPAASFFPEAARANRGVFYENGKPLALQAVYNRFEAKFEGADTPVVQTQVASTKDTDMPEVVLPRAREWGNPFANTSRSRMIEAFAPIPSESADTTATSRIGGFLSSPVDVMMMAQKSLRFDHEDSSRYNS